MTEETDGLYFCPAAREVESAAGGGFTVCCDRPQDHVPMPDTKATAAVSEALSAAAKREFALQQRLTALESAEVFPLPIRADGTHWYVSTYCVDGQHGACRLTCKCCSQPCQCAACRHEIPAEASDVPELTREELQELVDDLGTQAYRAEDVLAFVREMCDAADADGSPVTTARVRGWLGYTGCGGAIVLPDALQGQVREALALAPLRTPATQVSEPLPPFPYHLARCMGCDLLTDDCTCSPDEAPAVAGPAAGSEEQ